MVMKEDLGKSSKGGRQRSGSFEYDVHDKTPAQPKMVLVASLKGDGLCHPNWWDNEDGVDDEGY